jgi:alkanesulfonate monooxygenase SsuD/methylene tetrahydromethanopterin reductase-like flavin-dependent oxidoreductase (luciferase family)
MLDLNGTSRRAPVAGQNLSLADLQRRLTTTVSDLEDSVQRVRAASQAAGRPINAVTITLLVNEFTICDDANVPDCERAMLVNAALPTQSLDDCPYVFYGSPERIADKIARLRSRLRVDGLILTNNIDPRPLCERILPLL